MESDTSTNPYKAPATNVERREYELEPPEDILKKLKGGWIAGFISCGITLLFIVISMTGSPIMGLNLWSLIDVAAMAGLSYGVMRKSRTCAILLLALYTLNKVLMWMEAGTPGAGLLVTLAFFWFFIQGVIGAFQFHRWKREQVQVREF